MAIEPPSAEFAELVVRYLDRQITSDGLRQLNAQFADNESNCRFFTQVCYQSQLIFEQLGPELSTAEGKGVRYILPERPEGCFAQNVPDPFSLSLPP